MQCAGCGRPAAAGQLFCTGCGVALPVECRRCGRRAVAGDRFCGQCGGALSPPASSLGGDPLRYAPRHLVERVLRQRSAVEGEHKEVTVLFADIQGSMNLAAAVDPEELHTILDRYFAVLSEGVYRFEGCINQFTGDGIMALFGAPLALEEHARHACHAALSLRDAVRELGRELRRERGLDFAVRFGLNSGGVVVGSIGDDLRMDYTAQGQVVNLAARMEQLAEAGAIYLAPATASLVADYFELQDLGVFQVKGVVDGVRVHELLGPGAMRTRLDVSRERGLSRFVGRRVELATLESSVAPGGGRRVRVVADAGQGKSRLCHEFLQRRRNSGAVVHAAVGLSHGRSLDWLPVQQLYRSALGIGEDERGVSVRDRAAGKILLFGEEYRSHAAVICELLGLDTGGGGAALERDARIRHLIEALVRLLESAAAGRDVVLHFDDVHWFDAASLAFLRALFAAPLPAEIAIVASHRPDYDGAWMDGAGFAVVALGPLSVVETRELITGLVGTSPALTGLVEGIAERTAGNPFFAEEAVRALVDSGRLRGDPGRYTAGENVEVEIPPTVHAILAARIDRLPEFQKAVLQTAAVIGRNFSNDVLASATGMDAGGLAPILDELVARGFVYVSSRLPGLVYSFEHPLTQEVAERSLLSARRRALHAAVAEGLATTAGRESAEGAALIAMHWEAAGEAMRAARWSAHAARWLGNTDVHQTYAHWERVRRLIPPDTEDGAAQELRLRACRALLSIATRVGVGSGFLREIRAEGRALAHRLDDTNARAAVDSSYALALALEGRVTEARQIIAATRPLASPSGDSAGLVDFAITAAHVYSWSGDCMETIAVCDLGLPAACAAEADEPATQAWLRVMRSDGLVGAGRLAEGEAEIARALEIAERPRDLEIRGFALISLCRMHTVAGRYGDADRVAQAAIAIGHRTGSLGVWGMGTSFRARVSVVAGRWREAIDALEPMVEYLDKAGVVLFRVFAASQLALALGGAGYVQEAMSRARSALADAERAGARLFAVFGHLGVARAASLMGDLATARRHVDRAEAEVTELRMESMRADIYLAREETEHLAGDQHAAARWRALAAESLRQIGAVERAAAVESAGGGCEM